MANTKIEVLIQNIQRITTGDMDGKSCIQFMDDVWGLCKDNCESRITGLLGGFQYLTRQGVASNIQVGCDSICKFLEQFAKLVRARGISTADECRELISSDTFNTQDINTLIHNVTTSVKMNTPDIKCIADALVCKEDLAPQFVTSYAKITSDDVVVKPGLLVIGSGPKQEVRDVPVNIRSLNSNGSWFVCTVTSNMDEDRLSCKNQRKTTMNSRGKLYPIFAKVPAENLSRLKQLLPDCGKTCIPDLECEVKVAFPVRRGG